MALTVIAGPPNSGKTGILHTELRGSLPEGQPVLVLPQAPDVRRAAREFADRGVSGMRIVDFDQWAQSLWSVHGDGRRFVSPAAREAIVAEALAEVQLVASRRSAETPGFRRTLACVFARLDGRLGTPEDPVAAEISRVAVAYSRLLDRTGLIEPAEAARLLAESPPTLHGPVGVNRFTDLSAPQEALLTGLATCNEVLIALTWVRDSAATEALDGLISRFIDAGGRLIAATDEFGGDAALARLGRSVFSSETDLPAGGSLRLGLAAGPEAECALVASVAREAIDDGFAPEQVAITFRDVAGRLWVLARALEAQSVEAVFDVAIPFGQTPFGMAAIALLEAYGSPEDRHSRLLAFLSSPYSGLSTDDVAGLDRRWRRDRVPAERILAGAEDFAGAARDALLLARCLTSGEASAPKWKKLADRMLSSALRVTGQATMRPTLDSAAHRALLTAVNELTEVGLDPSARSVLSGLRSATVSTGGEETPGCVLVTEAHRLRGRRFAALVLGGLSSREFSAERSESLTEELLRRLGHGNSLDPGKAERLLYYMVVTRARERLVLVRQSSDASGEALRPSPFLEETLDLYRTAEEAAEGSPPPGMNVARVSAHEMMMAAPAFSAGRAELRRDARTRGPVAPPRGVLIDPESLELLEKREEFAVSEIEAYLSCPYRWFYQRALRPRELDAEFGARERGTRSHALMHAFYTAWHAAGHERITPRTKDAAIQMLREVTARYDGEAVGTPLRGLAEQLSASRADTRVASVIADDATFLPGFAPLAHELGFGERHARPVTFGGVKIAGSIDRVDANGSAVVVIDYKSSATVTGYAGFAKAGLVQAPAYAAAASAVLDRTVAGSIYRSMSSLDCRGFWLSDTVDLGTRGSARDGIESQAVQAVSAEAEAAVRRAVNGMREGRIPREPASPATCTSCPASAVCGGVR